MKKQQNEDVPARDASAMETQAHPICLHVSQLKEQYVTVSQA